MWGKIGKCLTSLALWPLLITGFAYAQRADSSQTIPDTLLFRIQQAQAVVTEVNAMNKKGYGLTALNTSLNEIKESIAPLQRDIKNKGTDTKNLLSYQLILKDAGNELLRLRNVLIGYNNELQRMSDQVLTLSKDTVLQIKTTDDAGKRLYQQQLMAIRKRLDETGKLTGANLNQVGQLLATVSALDITVNDLKAQVAERLRQSGKMALGRETSMLWQATWSSPGEEGIGAQLRSSYQGQVKIFSYFFESTWDKHIVLLFFAFAFFIWIHRNLRLAKRPAVVRKLGLLHFDHLKAYPVAATLIVGLNLVPLFVQSAPSLYIGLVYLLLLLIIAFHLRKLLGNKQLKGLWLLIMVYALLIMVSGISSNNLFLRLLLLGLNIFFICLVMRMLYQFRIPQFSPKYTKRVIIFFMAFNVLAIFLNVFGRLSLARLMGLTGAVGLVQLISLALFIQLVLDALELQFKLSACSKGLFSRINQGKTRASIKKLLFIVAALLWIVVFLINMNLTSGAMAFFETVLSKQRGFGNVHFTLGNILLFVLIIYIANKLQKNIPLLFGEGNLSYEGQVEQKSSKVALIRLIIVFIALMLALTASGLPMDRVTVVLGALGVGIGLGMQNIVNNFVSGIILIFERPFRIGDFVELADKKGRVKDIGIRSSRLLTQQGSEVIIPNGDLLSGRLVNWTLSHDYVKTELIFKVSSETDMAALEEIVKTQVAKTAHGMDHIETEILVNSITAGAIELKVMAWVENIYHEPFFKSELMIGLLKSFNTAGIKVA